MRGQLKGNAMVHDVSSYIPKAERLGEILIQRHLITRDQLREALNIQRGRKGFLGEILVEMGTVTEQDLVIALVVQCHFPYIAVDRYDIDPHVIAMIPAEMACRYRTVPLDKVGNVLSVVMRNPMDVFIRRELRKLTDCQIFSFIATNEEIRRAMVRWYHEE
jgi:type IV pilus assembly protein PilB